MNATAVEVEKEIGKAEREFSIAKEEFERAEADARAARGSDALSERRRVLDEKRAALEAAWARRGDPAPGQSAKAPPKGALVPSLMDKFMAASPENRETEMRVRSMEHEFDLLNSQIPPLERAFKAADEKLGRFVHNEPRNDEDGRHASANFSTALAVDRQRANAILRELTPLRDRFAKVQVDLQAARTKRDEMLKEFASAAGRK
jgi:hypothetical protein